MESKTAYGSYLRAYGFAQVRDETLRNLFRELMGWFPSDYGRRMVFAMASEHTFAIDECGALWEAERVVDLASATFPEEGLTLVFEDRSADLVPLREKLK